MHYHAHILWKSDTSVRQGLLSGIATYGAREVGGWGGGEGIIGQISLV